MRKLSFRQIGGQHSVTLGGKAFTQAAPDASGCTAYENGRHGDSFSPTVIPATLRPQSASRQAPPPPR